MECDGRNKMAIRPEQYMRAYYIASGREMEEKAKFWEAHQSVLTSNTIARASYAMMRACRRESKYSKSIKKKRKKKKKKLGEKEFNKLKCMTHDGHYKSLT